MKGKRFIVLAVLAMIMVGGLTSSYSIKNSEQAFVESDNGDAKLIEESPSVKVTHKSELVVDVYTETKDVFPKDVFNEVFTEVDMKFLEENLNANIIYLDDFVEVRIKTKLQPPSSEGLVLYADNKPIEVSSKGTILVDKDTKVVSKSNPVSDQHAHEKFSATELDDFNASNIEKTNSNKLEVIFRANSGDLLAAMEEKEDNFLEENPDIAATTKGYGDRYYPGDWVHCNRFNSYLSDHIHYNWRSGSATERAKALKNFYSSDCHIALVQAGSGCTSTGSCQCNTTQRAAYCSGYTKHKDYDVNCSYRYHIHADLVIPR